ncbi:MAG TPA: nickel-binding protein [Methylomirabilota bacterium]|nr:nickel-binding protein [Methylomirabilota bacterium]
MPLYVVERDLSSVPPEQFRLDQRDVASVCIQLKAQGKRIRYISSAVVPADGRALDLFGADSAELIKEAHTAAGVHYQRIVEILDLTPSFVHRETSRSRRSLQRAVGAGTDSSKVKGTAHTMTANSAPELARWLGDGQRLFAVCLETLESADRLQTRNQTLESENEMLREEVARLRHRVDVLQTDRSEMVAAFNDLAGHVTQVVDHILQKSEDGEGAK